MSCVFNLKYNFEESSDKISKKSWENEAGDKPIKPRTWNGQTKVDLGDYPIRK